MRESGRRPRSFRVDCAEEAGTNASDSQGVSGSDPSRILTDRYQWLAYIGEYNLRIELVRIMRILVGIGFAAEVEEEVYTATPLTVQMTVPASQACVRHQ